MINFKIRNVSTIWKIDQIDNQDSFQGLGNGSDQQFIFIGVFRQNLLSARFENRTRQRPVGGSTGMMKSLGRPEDIFDRWWPMVEGRPNPKKCFQLSTNIVDDRWVNGRGSEDFDEVFESSKRSRRWLMHWWFGVTEVDKVSGMSKRIDRWPMGKRGWWRHHPHVMPRQHPHDMPRHPSWHLKMMCHDTSASTCRATSVVATSTNKSDQWLGQLI